MLGIGIDVVNMYDNSAAQKYFNTNSGTTIYNMTMDQSAAGYGIQYDAGALYKFTDKIKGGVVVRSGTLIKMTGKATFDSNQTDYNEEYTYPMTYGAGVSYEPKKNITLALSFDQNNYSAMHETLNYKTSVGLSNSAGPLNGRNWKDTTVLHLGAEYRHTQKLAFRAGIQYDPAPFDTNQLSLMEINEYNFFYYSIGAGYKIGRVNLDFCYAYCPSDNPTIDGRSYTYNLDVFRLGARYSF